MVGVAGENLKREIRSIRLNLKSIGPYFFMSIQSSQKKSDYISFGRSIFLSYSEPAPVKPEGRVRLWSLPDMAEKRSRGQETMQKVKASPSRLQFPQQSLKNLGDEGSLSSLRHTSEAVRSRSSSMMSLVDNYDSQICDQHFPSQEPLEAEEVTGHWVNRNRRQSISKQPSFLMVQEVDEENEAMVRVPI